MKLIDMLVEDGMNGWQWPDGVECITQDNGSSIYKGVAFGYHKAPYLKKNIWLANNGTGHADAKIKKYDVVADDWDTAIITREQYEAALASKNDGWIDWGGGDCPVDGREMVDVIFGRGGRISTNIADCWRWNHSGTDSDIIAYRLHKPLEQQLPSEEVPLWNGEGLPPVGCECQYRKHKKSEQSEWFNGVVKYASEFTVVIQPVCHPGETVGHPANFEFLPIRPEAELKRDEAVKTIMLTGWCQSAAEEIYDLVAAGKVPGMKLED